MEELKPCPFCGGKAYGYTVQTKEIFTEYIHCERCNACSDVYETKQQAIEAWNTRHEPTCQKIPGKMRYGTRVPKCSNCGQSLGDKRWIYCPKCGFKVNG